MSKKEMVGGEQQGKQGEQGGHESKGTGGAAGIQGSPRSLPTTAPFCISPVPFQIGSD